MLKDVYAFAKRYGLAPAKNCKDKKLAAYVVLSENGQYSHIEVIDKQSRVPIPCPDIGTYSFQAKCSNPIAEKKGFIFPVLQENAEIPSKHVAWMQIMEDGAEHVPILKIVYRYLSQVETDAKIKSQLQNEFNSVKIKDADFISFRVGNIYLPDDTSWISWFNQYVDENYAKNTDAKYIVSSITGQTVESIPEKGAPMVNASATGTGVYPITIGEPAFESYGMEKNLGANIGLNEDKMISAGLEYLLKNGTNYNNNFGIIHWYEEEVEEDIIADSIDSSMDEGLEDRLNAMFSGNTSPDRALRRSKYYISRFSVPTKGRMFLSEMHIGIYNELCRNLLKWYQDSTIEVKTFDKETKQWITSKQCIKKIFQIFFSLISTSSSHVNQLTYTDKLNAVDHEFGTAKTELLYNIYDGKQIPKIFLRKAIERFAKDLTLDQRVNYTAVKIIHVYQERSQRMEDAGTKAYACGQMFAVYEQIQLASNDWKEVGNGITQRYFIAVQRTPQSIFPEIANLSVAHLNKIKNIGTKNFYRAQLGKIAEKIGSEFPKRFTDEEKGEFILGYYVQRNSYLKDKTENSNNNEEEK